MKLTNQEIAVYALYLVGGASRVVHTEDVALKCYELASDSFSWVKYPEHPDKEVVRHALMDARRVQGGQLVRGRTGRAKRPLVNDRPRSVDGWQLTEAGVRWVVENENKLAQALDQREPKAHRQQLLQKLSRIRRHPLFLEFKDQPESFVPSLGALAELLRCRVDATGAVWEKRFARYRNEARLADQVDVLAFLDVCERFINSQIGVRR